MKLYSLNAREERDWIVTVFPDCGAKNLLAKRLFASYIVRVAGA